MKPIRKYFFGYLFVRFAKLFALLTVLAGIGSMLTTSAAFFTASSAAGYNQSGELKGLLGELANEMDFATEQVGKISDTSDLQPIGLPAAPKNAKGFDKLDNSLAAVRKRNGELKGRVVREFEKQAGSILAQLDEFLASNAPEPLRGNPVAPKRPAPSTDPSDMERSIRRLFRNENGNYSRNAMALIEGSLLGLEEQAENPRNKKALRDAAAEVIRLRGWLPKEQANPNSRPSLEPVREEPVESIRLPESPFVQAQLNRQRMAAMIGEVRQLTTSGWILDDLITSAERLANEERQKYEMSRAAQSGLRIAWLGKIGINLFFTLAGAFAVLVIADWLQSFFDTATSALAIRGKVESASPDEKSAGDTA